MKLGEKIFSCGLLGVLAFGSIAVIGGLCGNDVPKLMFLPFAISTLVSIIGMLFVIKADK